MKQIVIALVDRLAAHAAREADSNDDDEVSDTPASPKAASTKAEEETSEKAEGETKEADGEQVAEENEAGEDSETKAQEAESAPAPKTPKVRRIRGIPEDVKLFEIFWGKIVDLVKVRISRENQTCTLVIILTILHPSTCRRLVPPRPLDPGYHCTLGVVDQPVVELLPR